MGLCSLSQRQHAADVQFQPARSYSRDDVIGALHQLLVGAQIILQTAPPSTDEAVRVYGRRNALPGLRFIPIRALFQNRALPLSVLRGCLTEGTLASLRRSHGRSPARTAA